MKKPVLFQARKASLKTKLLVSYILLFAFPLSIMGIGGNRWISDTVGAYEERVYRSILEKTISDHDAIFSRLNSVAEQLSNTTWIKKIISMQGNVLDETRVDGWSKIEYSQSIYALKNALPSVDELAVLFIDKNAVFASYGNSDLKFFAQNAFSINGMGVNEWLDLVHEIKGGESLIMPAVSVTKFGVSNRGSVFVRPLQPNPGQKPAGCLVAYINDQKLAASLKTMMIDEEIALTIASQDGEPFIQMGDQNIKSELVINTGSDLTGWQYKMTIPKHVMVRKAEGVRNVVLISVGLLLLLCLAVSLGFTRRLYRPLRDLISLVRNQMGEPIRRSTSDEYTWLQDGIHAMIEQDRTLIQELNRQKPILQEAWLGRLFAGEIEPRQEFEIALKLLDIHLPMPVFRVCIIASPIMPGSVHPPSLPDNLLTQIQSESDGRLFLHTMVKSGQIALVANYDNEGTLWAFITALIEKEPGIFIGLGNTCADLEGVARSFREASMAMDYRCITSENNITRFEDITHMKERYYYPLEKEYCISSNLKSGNFREAISIFDTLLAENLRQVDTSQEGIMNFLKNIELTALKVMDEADISSLIRSNRPEIITSKSILEIRNYIETLYQAVCETINQRNAGNSTLIHEIMQFVDESITDSALSLAMVADRFKVSVSYISRVYTEKRGTNFHHYINEKRIALARSQLLVKQDVSSVARTVGYESDVTFRRLFKQFTGLSPSEYRDQQRITARNGSTG